MLRLPEIYAENIRDWLPEMLCACLGTLKLSLCRFIVAAVTRAVRRAPAGSRRGGARGGSPSAISKCCAACRRGHPLYRLFRAAAASGLNWLVLFLHGGGRRPGAAWRRNSCRGVPVRHRGPAQGPARSCSGARHDAGARPWRYILLPQAMRIVLPPVGQLCHRPSQGHLGLCPDRRARADADGPRTSPSSTISRWRCSAWRRVLLRHELSAFAGRALHGISAGASRLRPQESLA